MGLVPLSGAVFLLLIYNVNAQTTTKCTSREDCGNGLQCCKEVCKKWQYCDGSCDHDKDCDTIRGESCRNAECKCIGASCNEITFPDSESCLSNADCKKSEICDKRSVCVKAHSSSSNDSTSNTLSWRTVVILIISVIVAVILVALFVHCSFRARAERRPNVSGVRRRFGGFGSVRGRSNMASPGHNRYDYQSAATNVTVDFQEDNAQRNSSNELVHIDDTPPSYDTVLERPSTPPPSYDEVVSVATGNSETRTNRSAGEGNCATSSV